MRGILTAALLFFSFGPTNVLIGAFFDSRDTGIYYIYLLLHIFTSTYIYFCTYLLLHISTSIYVYYYIYLPEVVNVDVYLVLISKPSLFSVLDSPTTYQLLSGQTVNLGGNITCSISIINIDHSNPVGTGIDHGQKG